MNSSPTVADTIAAQIGNRAFFMLGAKNLLASERALTFKVGKNDKRVTHVRVTLTPADVYRVEFLRVVGLKAPVTLADVEGVYADGLRQVIENRTG